MKRVIIFLLVLFVSACGGSGGGSSEQTSATSSFQKLAGDWGVQMNAPFTSCASLDLGKYAGSGDQNNWKIEGEEVGSFQYIKITVDGDSLKYTVTDNGDPFKMERAYDDSSKGCNWIGTRSYELTFVSDDSVKGIQKTIFTASTGFCEECYYTLHVEMNRVN